mmetsp:Transcript_2800/g.6834  ORF Transcript_2800/g.6834 Transcript_2800/m.6834 type:complete len:345 (-) Transcript_2800:137-1171(-)
MSGILRRGLSRAVFSRATACAGLQQKRTLYLTRFEGFPKLTEVGIVGAPFAYGQHHKGVDTGPQSLRDAGLVTGIQNLGFTVVDDGDLEFECYSNDEKHEGFTLRYPRTNGEANRKVFEAVKKHAEAGRFTLTLGGDHSIGCGTVAGIMAVRPETAVIWVDAHSDINIPNTSPSGNFHGMPVAFLLGLGMAENVPGFEWFKRCMDPRQIAYIGLRDLDAGEKAILRKFDIAAYTMHDVDKYGIATVLDMAISAVNRYGRRPMHLSFDIDSVDPSYAPSTGTSVQGGLTFREAHYVAETLAATHSLCSMDMVEVNPHLELPAFEADKTVMLGRDIVLSALGRTIL